MSTFAYTALGKDGQRTTGTLSADSRSAALAQINGQGLKPVSLQESRSKAGDARKAAVSGKVGRIPKRAVEGFIRELANLLAGGVPLSRALGLLRRESSNPSARIVWGKIHDDIVGGTALCDAMGKWPKVFPAVYVAMVRAGEAGGFLDVVLTQIADFRAREADLKGKVKSAMVYPCILAVLAVGVLIFLLTFFIPQFSGIFEQFGGSLPALTQLILTASNFVKGYWWVILGVTIVVVVGFRRMQTTKAGRRQLEIAILSTPFVGTVIARFALVRFARMLGTLVSAGVPLIASLKVAREAIGNQTLADTVLHATEQVQRGSPLSASLANSPRLFPASVVEMIAVAEETGRLDKELLRLALAYETDLDRQLRMLVSVAEPLMLFLMASVIGTVVIGMLLPVFNMGSLIHQ